jgi:hypothetical protein
MTLAYAAPVDDRRDVVDLLDHQPARRLADQ